MTPTRADRRRSDDLILRAAARRLAVDPAATLQQIADDAGVSRLTLYRGFADRAALVTALRTAVDAELDLALATVPAWTDETDDVDTLAALVRALVGVATRFPIAVLRYSPVPGRPPPVDVRLVALLRRGQRAGALRRDVTPDQLNAMLFGTLAALVLGAGPTGPSDPSDPSDPHLADTVVTLLRSGMAAPEGPRR